jgi:hypothetical protein
MTGSMCRASVTLDLAVCIPSEQIFRAILGLRCSQLTTPTVCRTFQSFGALRNLPCADARSVSAIWRCGISSRVCNTIGARRSVAHTALVLGAVDEMRGGAARSNLQTAARILWIDPWTADALAGSSGSISNRRCALKQRCRRGRRRSEIEALVIPDARSAIQRPEATGLSFAPWVPGSSLRDGALPSELRKPHPARCASHPLLNQERG